jgi:uncharacterized protein YlaI
MKKPFFEGYRITIDTIQVKVKAIDSLDNTVISHKTLKNKDNITGLLRGEILRIFKEEEYKQVIAIHFNFIPEEMFGDKL